MSIHRPNHHDAVHRLQPVYGDPDEGEQRNNSRQKKVLYNGRSWAETIEDNIPITPKSSPQNKAKTEEKTPIFVDEQLYKEAKKKFDCLTTLEEKIAQLCFYQTEASYDPQIVENTRSLIQNYQIGGILFTSGEYKRQIYLMEYYQSLTKTPLLIGNDFHHGLSFFSSELSSKNPQEQRFYDLGKVVMHQNIRMGVHFQCDRNVGYLHEQLILDESALKAFRKGIRATEGIVGKFQRMTQTKRKSLVPQFSVEKGASYTHLAPGIEEEIQEILGLKTVEFYDLTALDGPLSQEQWNYLFYQSRDLFLLSHRLPEAIEAFCQAVRTGTIKEEELDKRVFKALLVKTQMTH